MFASNTSPSFVLVVLKGDAATGLTKNGKIHLQTQQNFSSHCFLSLAYIDKKA